MATFGSSRLTRALTAFTAALTLAGIAPNTSTARAAGTPSPTPSAPDTPSPAASPTPTATPHPTPPATQTDGYTAFSHWMRDSQTGLTTSTLFPVPAFRHDTASWRPVDDTVTATGDPTQPFSADGAVVPVHFGDSASQIVQLELGAGPVTVSAPALSLGTPQLAGGDVVYSNVAPGADLSYALSQSALQEEIVLHSAQAPGHYAFHLSDPHHQLGSPHALPNGGYAFDGQVADGVGITIPVAMAYTQGAPSVESNPRQIVTPAGDGFDVTIDVDPTWLAQATFPVVIDPTLAFGGAYGSSTVGDFGVGSNTDCQGGRGNCVFGPGQLDLLAGRGTWNGYDLWERTLLRFDLSSIPYGSAVQSGRLDLYQATCMPFTYCTSEVPGYAGLHKYTQDPFPSGGVTFNTANSYIDGFTYASVPFQGTCGYANPAPCDEGFANTNVTSLIGQWVTGTVANDGFILLTQNEGTQNSGGFDWPSTYYPSNGTNRYPTLTVTYLSPPDPPTNVVATPGTGQASVTWQAPANNGGSAITNYTVTEYPDATVQTPTGTSATFSGLTNCNTYSFSAAANNTIGSSAATYSNSVVPGSPPSFPPTAVAAQAGNASAEVTWTAPAAGGCPVTGYTITPYVNGVAQNATTVASTATSYTVAGLTNGAAYTFKVLPTSTAGNGPNSSASAPITPTATFVPPFQCCARVHLLAGGVTHSLGIKTDGTVWSWGKNDAGQLGVPTATTASSSTPIPVPGVTSAIALAAGNGFSLALESDGSVWAWGSNSNGQLGQSTTVTTNSTATKVAGLTGVVAIAAGYSHAIAVKSDGTVWSWGYNFYGQLGNNSTTDSSTPVQASGLTGASTAAGNAYGTTVLKTDGTVAAWGYNGYGTLGNGTYANSSVPVAVAGISGGASIAAGYYHSSVEQSGGTVWSWGYNGRGQLGNTTTTDSIMPTEMVGIAKPLYLAADGYFTLVLQNNGTLKAVGGNGYGQLGNGNTTAQSSPVVVGSSFTAGHIAAGSAHALAYQSDGSLWTWGYNVDGELGNGSTTNTSTPGKITGFLGPSAPTAPLAPSATGGNAQATVIWTAPLSANGSPVAEYAVQPVANGVPQAVVATKSTTPTFTVTGLTNGVSYTFVVYALNCVGLSTGSMASNAVTPDVVPNPPGTPTATPGNHQVTLQWTAPTPNGGTPVNDYTISVSPNPGSSPIDTHSTSTQYTVTGLTNGTAYTFTVTAVNGAGPGAPSGSVTSTPRTVPNAPTSVQGSCGNAQAVLSWQAPANNGAAITDYLLTVSPNPGGSPYSTQSNTAQTVTGLTNGTNYSFTVAAVNAAGTGPQSSPAVACTPDVVPNAPGIPTATSVGNGQVSLTWAQPNPNGGTAVNDYFIQVYPNGASTPSRTIDTGNTATQTSYTVTGLTNGTPYRFAVYARNPQGPGAASAQSGSSTPDVAPAAPAKPTTATGNGQVTVSWSAPGTNGGSAITDYLITISPNPGSSPVDTGSTATTYTVVGLTNGTAYTFSVAARNTLTGPYSPASDPATPHIPPTIAKTSDRAQYSRGDDVLYTVTVTNGSPTASLPLDLITDNIPSTLSAPMSMPVTVAINGGAPSACNAGTTPTCVVGTGQKLQVSNMPALNGGAFVRVVYTVIAVGSDRQCAQATNNALATSHLGDSVQTSTPVTICQSGLGLESWWSYLSQSTGPQGAASVNVADGNLVVQQTDGIPIQGHGHIAYVIRRTYNSQDVTGLTLPGSLGGGWLLNVGQTDELAGAGVTTTGLYIPSGQSLAQAAANPLSITLIDRDGTRHVFTPRALSAITVSGLTGPQAVLNPQTLTADAGYTLLVDQAYDPPAGVHMGIWRYSETCTSQSCSGQPNVVVGYGAERPDRLRTEFSADGRLLSMVDPSGVELRYLYDGQRRLVQVYEPRSCTPQAPQPFGTNPLPSPCRRVDVQYSSDGRTIKVWDPSGATNANDAAGRPTVYHLDGATPVSHLTGVDNPDGSQIAYSYGTDFSGTACSTNADQLCAIRDPRLNVSSVVYGANPVGGAQPRVISLSDRRGNATTLAYSANLSSVTADRAGERQVFSAIDTIGRVGELDQGDTSSGNNAYLHSTQFSWDSTGSACRQPDGAVDNNLCRVVRFASPGSPSSSPTPNFVADEDTYYLYNHEGGLLLQRRNLGTQSPVPGSACALCLDTTYGYHVQYVQASGATQQYDDAVNGSGWFTPFSARPTGTSSLFSILDQTQSLTPRGNDPGNAGAASGCSATPAWRCYLTTSIVENAPTAAPNPPANSSQMCGTPGSPTQNTGLVCEVDSPLDGTVDGGGNPVHAVTRYTYDGLGEKLTMITPKAWAEQQPSPPAYSYSYYGDSDTDLSGDVSAGGWLRTIADPSAGHPFAAMAYDRAGHVVRTWDRNATSGHQPTEAPSALGAQYAETGYGSGFATPWRYVTSSTDADPANHNRTIFARDPNGNQTTITPPRGSSSNHGFDVTQGFDQNDNLTSVLHPVERAAGAASRYSYDVFNNRVETVDPDSHITVTVFDAVNRPIETKWTRGAYDASNLPKGCRQSGSGDAPIALNEALCFTTTTFDAVDNVVARQAANAHTGSFGSDFGAADSATFTFDPAHRQIQQLAPQDAANLAFDETDTSYDLDGHPVDVYPPRAFTEGPKAAFDVHSTFDPAGRLTSRVTQRTATQSETVLFAYDADGNPATTTDANGHVTADTFDVLDRKTAEARQRDANSADNVTTTWQHDLVGNTTAAIQPGNLITAYSFDFDNRPVDSVVGADSVTAGQAGLVDSQGGKNIRTRQIYDADGHVVARYNPNAFVTSTPNDAFKIRTDYDADGRPVVQYVPRYDAGAQSPAIIDATMTGQCKGGYGYPSGVGVCVTQIQYDANGNRLRVIMPTSSTTVTNPVSNPSDNRYIAYSYTDDNLLVSVDQPKPDASGTRLPNAQTTYYDGAGNATKTVDALGNAKVAAYFDNNQVRQSTDANGPVTHTTSYGYDSAGEVTQVIDGLSQTSRTTYFNDGLKKDVTDPAGDKTSYTYDGAGSPLTVMSPSGNACDSTNCTAGHAGTPTTYSYTFDELLLSQATPTRADGTQVRRTTYGYDPAGRKLCQRVDLVAPGTAATSCTQGQSDPVVQSFGYLNDGRISTESQRGGAPAVSLTYDAAGNRTVISDAASGTTLTATYYLDDLVRQVSDGSRTTSYTYDGAGSRLAAAEGGGAATQTTSLAYLDAGLPASMTSTVTGGGTTSWTYDNASRPHTEADPNGATVAWQFNSDGTLAQQSLTGQDGTALATWGYTYDANYRQLTQAFSGQSAGTGAGFVTDTLKYTYDTAHRLASFQQGTNAVKSVQYDHDGNRTQFGTSLSWTHNADDSIASSTDTSALTGPTLSYQYDTFGQLADDGCTTNQYDGLGRLSQSAGHVNTGTTRCATPATVTFSYDALDRQTGHTEAATSATQHYDGLSQAILVETPSHGGEVTYELTPDGAHRALAQAGTGGVQQYMTGDGHGNISTVVASSTSSHATAVACTIRFDPWGSPIGSTTGPCNTTAPSGTPNDFFYRGGRLDSTTHDYQFGSRTYDPTKASFLTPDSYRTGDSAANLSAGTDPLTRDSYAYVNGDPVNLADPTGHRPSECSGRGDCRDSAHDTPTSGVRTDGSALIFTPEVPVGGSEDGRLGLPAAYLDLNTATGQDIAAYYEQLRGLANRVLNAANVTFNLAIVQDPDGSRHAIITLNNNGTRLPLKRTASSDDVATFIGMLGGATFVPGTRGSHAEQNVDEYVHSAEGRGLVSDFSDVRFCPPKEQNCQGLLGTHYGLQLDPSSHVAIAPSDPGAIPDARRVLRLGDAEYPCPRPQPNADPSATPPTSTCGAIPGLPPVTIESPLNRSSFDLAGAIDDVLCNIPVEGESLCDVPVPKPSPAPQA